MEMKKIWDTRRESDQIAFLYLGEGTSNKALTLYWGHKWGYGQGFTVSGGIGGTYYSHAELSADNLEDAKAEAERFLYEKYFHALRMCLKSADSYAAAMEALKNPT